MKKILWHYSHERILRELYETTPVKVIAERINKRPDEVKDRARLLGLKSLPRSEKLKPLHYYNGQPKYRINANGCWVWTAARNAKGYPLSRGKDTTLAHRQIYIDKHGTIPDGYDVDHKCQNRACVNIDHLEAVTHQVNIQRGSKTKLTPEQVESIRGQNDERDTVLAERYGVDKSTIDFIQRGYTWTNL